MKLDLARAAIGALFFASFTASACSSCGCTLSSDWDSQGYANDTGFRVDLRFDYLNQSRLVSGRDEIRRGDIALPSDREIERDTINRYTTLGLDYSPNAAWGVNVQLPWIDRSHATWPDGETELSTSDTHALGDVRVLARYQGFRPQHDVGVQFGLKLPTGRHDDTFDGGDEAGEALDRGLQAGSGSTDLLLGAYRFGALAQNWDAFAQGQAQIALTTQDDYRPGSSLSLNAGLRYLGLGRWTPQLQLNLRSARRDSGAEADVDNSGGTFAYLSPGLSVALGERWHAYGFVQLPVYERANGLQLAPRITASLGMRYRF
jgi:hypothetical protein